MAMENDTLIGDLLLFDIVCRLVEWWFSKSQTVSHYQRVDPSPLPKMSMASEELVAKNHLSLSLLQYLPSGAIKHGN